MNIKNLGGFALLVTALLLPGPMMAAAAKESSAPSDGSRRLEWIGFVTEIAGQWSCVTSAGVTNTASLLMPVPDGARFLPAVSGKGRIRIRMADDSELMIDAVDGTLPGKPIHLTRGPSGLGERIVKAAHHLIGSRFGSYRVTMARAETSSNDLACVASVVALRGTQIDLGLLSGCGLTQKATIELRPLADTAEDSICRLDWKPGQTLTVGRVEQGLYRVHARYGPGEYDQAHFVWLLLRDEAADQGATLQEDFERYLMVVQGLSPNDRARLLLAHLEDLAAGAALPPATPARAGLR